MRFMEKCKDGGPESPVDSFTLIEIKSLFSIMLLRFNKGKRESFHNHAFNALTWFINGELIEERLVGGVVETKYKRSPLPKITKRDNLHRVKALKDSWCLTVRGPWSKTWSEYDEHEDTNITLSNGRVVLSTDKGVPK